MSGKTRATKLERSRQRGGAPQGVVLLLVALAIGLAVSGCMRPQPSPGELLSRALTQYHSHLIFERFDEAAGFVPAPRRNEFMDYYKAQRGELRVLEFDVTRVEISSDEQYAHAEIMLRWHRLPSTTVETSTMTEEWNWDDTREQWEVTEQTLD